MPKTYSFRFVDPRYNRAFHELVGKAKISHSIDSSDAIEFSEADEELVENELIPKVRDQVFPSWQVLSCPRDWVDRYKTYMKRNGVPFVEELSDGHLCFLIPQAQDPHSWNLG